MRAFARGRAAHDDEVRRLLLWGAWHQAAWSRVKRLPRIASILRKLGGREPVKKTTKQLLVMAEHLNALFGGKDTRKGKGK